ncbi:MAG: hypothetical protein KC621_16295, partial [Myxococcales bacterium]|nr:hypothetical protein [Myxococcales bacterium]
SLFPLPMPTNATGLWVQTGDPDYWSLTIPANTSITIDVSFLHADADIDITLQDFLTIPLATGSSITDDEQVTYANYTNTAQELILYVRVYSGSAGSCATYGIQATTSPVAACPADGDEPNQTEQTAHDLAVGTRVGRTVSPSDPDWYTFTLPAFTSRRIQATNTSGGNLDLSLQDSTGAEIDFDLNIPWEVYVANATASAQTYRLLIQGDACVTYDLVSTNEVAADCSTPDALEAAVPSSGTWTDLNVSATDDDSWNITVPAGYGLNATVTPITPASGPLAISVTDGSASDSASFAPRRVSLTNASGATDVFTLSVTTSTCVEYDLVLDLQVCGADDVYEDNDDSSTATSMETALASTGQATLNGLVASGTDADWFYMGTLLAGTTYTADLTFIDAVWDIDARFVDATGTTLAGTAGGTSSTDDEHVTLTTTTTIPVWLRVFLFSPDACSSNTYDLSVTAN